MAERHAPESLANPNDDHSNRHIQSRLEAGSGPVSLAGSTGRINPKHSCRVDLHLHSRFSQESDLWVLRQAGIGESNTDPETAYRKAKERGMTYVTLTDHNTIEGALRLADRPDFFISEEITTYFPDEDVKLHVLAYGITEEQHDEAQQLRRNMYELAEYLRREDVLYVLAHPLTRLGGELTPGHIERLMLLFPIWEVHNGSTLERENSFSRRLAELATPERLEELAQKHQLAPVTRAPITYTAGSDDHGGLDIASAWTMTRRMGSIAEFLAEVKSGRCEIGGGHGSTQKLAHTMLGLLASADTGGGAEAGTGCKGARRSWPVPGWPLSGLLGPGWQGGRKWISLLSLAVGGDSASSLFRTLMTDSDLRHSLVPMLGSAMKPGRRGGDEFHSQLFSLINAAWAAGMRTTISGLSDVNVFNFVSKLDKIGRLVSLQMLLFPHSLAANYHARQRHFLARLEGEMFGRDAAPDDDAAERAVRPAEPHGAFSTMAGRGRMRRRSPALCHGQGPRVGLFTDTFDEVNGISSIMQRLNSYCREEQRPLDIICCGEAPVSQPGVVRFPAVTAVNLPQYGELDLSIPPVLNVIKHCEEQQLEVIHAATPGPLGLTAFLVSRILQLPLVTSYHTDVPRVIGRITDDKLNEEAAWTYTRWFYRRSDLIFAPSVYTSRDLASHGLDQHKMAVLYQGIDADFFTPALRGEDWRQRLGAGDKKLMLFVGRLSQEKELAFLADCYLELLAHRDDVHLAIVGDGPMSGELKAMLNGNATILGWLEGEDLARAYAAADLFVFPSSVDTSGQVVLEAQAAGLPVVLSNEGGPRENIEIGVSGLAAPPRSLAGFVSQIGLLLDDPGLRRRMSLAARRNAERRSWEKVFGDLFDTYSELVNWWRPLSARRIGEQPGYGDSLASSMPLEFLFGGDATTSGSPS